MTRYDTFIFQRGTGDKKTRKERFWNSASLRKSMESVLKFVLWCRFGHESVVKEC